MDIYIKCSWHIWERIPRIEIDIIDIEPEDMKELQEQVETSIQESLGALKDVVPDEKRFKRTIESIKMFAKTLKRRFERVDNG